MVAPGANATLELDDDDRALIGGADVVLTNHEIPAAATLEALRAAHGAGVTAITPPTFIAPPRTFIQNNRPPVASNFGTVFAIDPELETPQVDQWSLGFQKSLGKDYLVEVEYVGNTGQKLPQRRNLNVGQLDPTQAHERTLGADRYPARTRHERLARGEPPCSCSRRRRSATSPTSTASTPRPRRCG